MAYQVIVTTALCYGLWFRHDAALSGVAGDALHPAGAGLRALTAVLLLNESYDWQMVLGALVTVSASPSSSSAARNRSSSRWAGGVTAKETTC